MMINNEKREAFVKEQKQLADLSVDLTVNFLTISYLKDLAKREGVTMNDLFNDMINVFKDYCQNLRHAATISKEVLAAVGSVFPDHSFPRSAFAYTSGTVVTIVDIPEQASNQWEARALKLQEQLMKKYGVECLVKLVYKEDPNEVITQYLDGIGVRLSDLHYIK